MTQSLVQAPVSFPNTVSLVAWSLFATPVGWVGMQGNADGVLRLLVGYPSSGALAAAIDAIDPHPQEADWSTALRTRLCHYLEGQRDNFSDVAVATQWSTPFQREVIARLRAVPFGQTVSYRDLAEQVGRPAAARAVGQVMATNPVPLIVPCHRVLGSGGRLGGFSAPTGVELKRRLLALEAVPLVYS